MTASHNEIHDPAIIAQQPLITQAYLAPTAVEWLLICFANDRQLFDEARALIASHHFKLHEAPLRILYDALCLSTDRYGGATYETLSAIVSDMLQQNKSLVLTEYQREVFFRRDEQGLIWQVCNPGDATVHATNRAFSRDLLRRFANERTIVEPLRKVMNPGFNTGVPENLGDFLNVINSQQARLSTLNSIPEAMLAPAVGTPLVSSNKFLKTGVAFLDELLGGQRVGDCNGIIGPTGGGKTTMGIHIAVAGAKQAWMDAQLNNTRPGLVVFVTAEESAEKLIPRIWSAFFHIPRTKLENLTDWGTLTQPGMLDPYEIRMQQDQEYKLSEIERYTAYAPQLASCMKLLDLSGSDAFPNAGAGFVPEVVSYLSRYDQPIRTVVIDYAGIFCERYINAQGLDESAYRYLLKTFGDRCRLEIAAKFGATTWVLHQLKGSMGKSNPGRLMHHSDAGESADFANNMVVCGCLGVADPYTGCRRFCISKSRYMPNEKIAHPTLKINEHFSLMEDVTRLYTINEAGQFMTPEDQHQIRGTAGLQRQQRPTAGPPGFRDTSIPGNPTQIVET